jgi:hypothetical protein
MAMVGERSGSELSELNEDQEERDADAMKRGRGGAREATSGDSTAPSSLVAGRREASVVLGPRSLDMSRRGGRRRRRRRGRLGGIEQQHG